MAADRRTFLKLTAVILAAVTLAPTLGATTSPASRAIAALVQTLEQRQTEARRTAAARTTSDDASLSLGTPAQALAYRMGRQTFVRLRERATARLGARFDIRRFHDAVLSVGSMPLFVLERHIDWWIAQELAR